jgi:thiol-disulfide isomerase/thioredoxin
MEGFFMILLMQKLVSCNDMLRQDSFLRRSQTFIVVGLLILIASCGQGSQEKKEFTINAPGAPEVNSKYGWLNTDRSYSLKDLRGKIVLLDFWTLGCINCQHIIPQIKKLQEKFARELVVIGVHSAKFKSERETQRIRSAISKFGIDHPVVNDADYAVWKAYGVAAWPTLVLISPDGKIAFSAEGENVFNVFDPQIEKLVTEYKDAIDTRPFVFKQQETKTSSAVLKFPSKMIIDEKESIWLSDYGNDRVVKIDKTGKILEIIGKGGQGSEDGSFSTATFNGPQGLAIRNDSLWIADSKNNSIRLADLATKRVTTVAGNGKMGYYFNNDKWNEPVLPNSPWDLLIDKDYLYIADAGNHQVLRMDLKVNKVYRFAGSGFEGIKDSDLRTSTFSQPSGLTKKAGDIYVADPEASAIRKIDLKNGTVKTIIGKGLFKFGDEDGVTKNVLLQHCVGLAEGNDNIYIADTYNGKVKVLNTKTNTVSTLVTDLNEPNDILIAGPELWITDTNNDQIIKFNLVTKAKEIVHIRY